MSTPCDWVASKLEAIGTEAVGTDDPKLLGEIRSHALTCPACAHELASYETLDHLLGALFAWRMARASRSPVRRASRVLIAAAAAAALLLAVWIGAAWSPFSDSPVPPAGTAAGPVIGDLEDPSSLAKPSEESAVPTPDLGPAEAVTASDDSFSVIDAAGYARTLADFRGAVLVLGVFDAAGTGGRTFRDLYETVPAQPGLTFLAVRVGDTPDLPRGDLEGIPIMANRGSRLLGIGSGEFAVLDPEGRIHSRGFLTDSGARSAIQSGLAELGLESE